MKIILIRHGQSANNAVSVNDAAVYKKRSPDPPLTELGRKQSRYAAEWLNQHFTNSPSEAPTSFLIYCSAMRRGLETAKIVSKKLKCASLVEVKLLLHEDGGLFKGTRGPKSRSNSPNMLQSAKDMSSASLNANDIPISNNSSDSDMCGVVEKSTSFYTGDVTRSEIERLYPKFRIPDEMSENGWWGRGRETQIEVEVRTHQSAKWFWELSESCDLTLSQTGERTVPVVVTHGMNQDSIIRILTTSACRDGICTCLQDAITFQKSTLQGRHVSGQLIYIPPLRPVYYLSSNCGISIVDFHKSKCPANVAIETFYKEPNTTKPEVENITNGDVQQIDDCGNVPRDSTQVLQRTTGSSSPWELTYPQPDFTESTKHSQTDFLSKQDVSVGICGWNICEHIPPHERTGQVLGPFQV